jgi:hypothetical protein
MDYRDQPTIGDAIQKMPALLTKRLCMGNVYPIRFYPGGYRNIVLPADFMGFTNELPSGI